MSPGQTSDRIYRLLKTQIRDGSRSANERLDPARLAMGLGASTTPVRDALHRLLGERMIEAWPREGFKVPMPTEAGLRDLYTWHGDLLDLVLRSRKSAARLDTALAPSLSDDPVDRTRRLFSAIAQSHGGEEHSRAIENAGERLHRARRAEEQVFADIAPERDALISAWSSAQPGPLRLLLSRYHRRRCRHVTEIIAAIIADAPPRQT